MGADMEITQEELKNMSPEEIAELQKKQCVFCHIVTGKVASKKIYEDKFCIAILDINPANPGHLLLITKEHYQIMPQVPDEVIGHMFMIVKHLSQAALKALQVKGINVVIANGIAAGQRAPHFMIHIIPRTDDDGLKFIVPQKKISDGDLRTLMKSIQPRINKVFGLEEKELIDLDVKPEKLKPRVVEAEFEEEQEPEEEKKEEDVEVGKEESESKRRDDGVRRGNKRMDLDKIAELFGK